MSDTRSQIGGALDALVSVCLAAYEMDDERVEAVMAAARAAHGGGGALEILEAAEAVRREWA